MSRKPNPIRTSVVNTDLLAARQVFTTGEIAKLCHVAPRTVSKWFDSGRLKGYRIPMSTDRRVPKANLIAFMQENKIPLDSLSDDASLRPGTKEVLLPQGRTMQASSDNVESFARGLAYDPTLLRADCLALIATLATLSISKPSCVS